MLGSRVVWLVSFVAWAMVGLFNIAPVVGARLSEGRPMPVMFIQLVAASMFVWALYTPAILALCERLPLRARTVGVHAACAVVVALIDPLIDLPFVYLIEPVPEGYTQRLLEELFINVFAYVAVAGIGYALAYRHRVVQQEAELLRARFDALSARLQPHFLFNSLHSVTSLIRTGERDEAVRAVVGLGELLRESLAANGGATVPLGREVAWIRRYFAIEQMRFADRLEVAISIDDGLEEALVPALVLQPLVENAIRHGVEARVGGSRVEVVARREASGLVMEVTDSGDVRAPTTLGHDGIGLDATRTRLAHLFGAQGRCELEVADGWSRARIEIPYRSNA